MIKTSDGAKNLVHQDLQPHVVIFSKCWAVPICFIICLDTPDIAEDFQAVVEEREKYSLCHDDELILGHDK